MQQIPRKRALSSDGELTVSSKRQDTGHSSDLETAAPETIACQWPADFYAVDIIHFFSACENDPTTKTDTIFYHHFPNVAYRRSTVNENRRRWKNATQDIRDYVLNAKRTDEGKWSVFQRKSRKNM